MEDFASDVEDFMSGGAAPTIRDELGRGPATIYIFNRVRVTLLLCSAE